MQIPQGLSGVKVNNPTRTSNISSMGQTPSMKGFYCVNHEGFEPRFVEVSSGWKLELPGKIVQDKAGSTPEEDVGLFVKVEFWLDGDERSFGDRVIDGSSTTQEFVLASGTLTQDDLQTRKGGEITINEIVEAIEANQVTVPKLHSVTSGQYVNMRTYGFMTQSDYEEKVSMGLPARQPHPADVQMLLDAKKPRSNGASTHPDSNSPSMDMEDPFSA